MAIWDNHYERAFAAHVRQCRLACIPFDETRRTLGHHDTIKSLDFIISVPERLLLIDVKGRRLTRQRSTPQNWATRDDIDSLARWQEAFGQQARALLAFTYCLDDPALRYSFVDSFEHEGRTYGCVTVTVADYAHRMRMRSPRWRTVNLRSADFQLVARPLSHWLSPAEVPF